MSKTHIDDIKLGGARQKNGHRLDCTCHICENMKNKAKRGGYTEEEEKQAEYISGGSKKKNGHRLNCNCPICKNMSHKQGGNKSTRKVKGNGHKVDCKCPICKNMRKKGGQNPDQVLDNVESNNLQGGKKKGNGHKVDCKCPICKNMRKKGGQPPDDIDVNSKEKEVVASDDEYDQLENIAGGSRKNKRLLKKSRKTKRRRS